MIKYIGINDAKLVTLFVETNDPDYRVDGIKITEAQAEQIKQGADKVFRYIDGELIELTQEEVAVGGYISLFPSEPKIPEPPLDPMEEMQAQTLLNTEYLVILTEIENMI